jgi:Asp-tRNA(Asn)/Glu-tRNA(Gln) amidotransferase A subunit family amidase
VGPEVSAPVAEPDASALTASAALAQMRAGRLTSEALVQRCLGRIAAREAQVGAWECLDADAALAAARAADRARASGADLGLLHGIPVGIKDIIDTVDLPTALGSPIYAGRRCSWDAAGVAALRRAGALILGKTVTTEFAFFQPGKTRNPHDPARTPGGSSSGSAAAVADAMVPLALGTQTAGSVIRPAAFCGVFGYKASFGEFALSGIRPFAESLDTLGAFARCVDDLAIVRSALAGSAPESADSPADWRPRIGVCRTPQWDSAADATREAVERTAAHLARAGAQVEPLALPEAFAGLVEAQRTVMAYEAARNYAFEQQRHADLLSEPLRALFESGWRIARADCYAAKALLAQARASLPAAMGGCDVLLAPAVHGEPPLASAGTGDPLFCRTWTALHLPCLAVPAWTGPSGLPVGVQLVAAFGADALLLRAGRWIERRLPIV